MARHGRKAATQPGTPSVQYLFVQTSSSGTLEGDRLTLRDAAAQTIFFSDRPRRIAGHLSVEQFVRFWNQGPNSFRDDPPNATLAFVAKDIESAVVVVLHDPVLAGTTLTYRVRILQGTPQRTFDNASLFIDAGGLMQLVAYGSQ
jgi:hypothetical protein